MAIRQLNARLGIHRDFSTVDNTNREDSDDDLHTAPEPADQQGQPQQEGGQGEGLGQVDWEAVWTLLKAQSEAIPKMKDYFDNELGIEAAEDLSVLEAANFQEIIRWLSEEQANDLVNNLKLHGQLDLSVAGSHLAEFQKEKLWDSAWEMLETHKSTSPDLAAKLDELGVEQKEDLSVLSVEYWLEVGGTMKAVPRRKLLRLVGFLEEDLISVNVGDEDVVLRVWETLVAVKGARLEQLEVNRSEDLSWLTAGELQELAEQLPLVHKRRLLVATGQAERPVYSELAKFEEAWKILSEKGKEALPTLAQWGVAGAEDLKLLMAEEIEQLLQKLKVVPRGHLKKA
eukprot:gene30901-35172_t